MEGSQEKSNKGQVRRTLILDTTLQLIANGGVDCVTHRRVADTAGIPLGSTTYYFESREHLLRDAFDYYLSKATAMQSEVQTRPIADVSDFVGYLVELTNREFENESMLLAEYEMTLYAARDDHVASGLHQWDKTNLKKISDVLRKLGSKKPKEAAQTILNLMRGYELDRLSRHTLDSKNFRARLEVVVTALVATD